MDSHKLIVILFLMNMMIHLSADMYFSPETVDEDYLSNEDTIARELGQDFKDERATPTSGTEQSFENTFGSGIGMGWNIAKAFFKGLVPWPVTVNTVQTSAEKMMVYGMNIFKGLFYMIVILEGYMIWKNRKTN